MKLDDIVRGPMGRRYRILAINPNNGTFQVQRVKVDGMPDLRCTIYNFPASYLRPLEGYTDANNR